MGGAQPLAADACRRALRGHRMPASRASTSACARATSISKATTIDEALALIAQADKPISIGLLGNAADLLPEFARRARAGGPRPAAVTDQTSAHDLFNGYLPQGWSVAQWDAARTGPDDERARLAQAAARSCAVHVRAMLEFHRMGVPTIDYGNNIRQVAKDQGVADAFDFPGFVPAYIRPLFCEGKGPFRWVALSGDADDIYRTDAKVKELFPDDQHLHRWLDHGARAHRLPGTAGAHLLARARRSATRPASRSTRWCATASSRRRSSSAATISMPARSPARTAKPKRCATAPTRCPTGRCSTRCSTTAGGATWVSLHHGGGVGMGYSQHGGVVIVADGSEAADRAARARAVERPGDSVSMRHADAGYQPAIALRARAAA